MNLAELGALPKLEELEIHRSDTLAKLPAEVGAARHLKKLKLEFLEALTDLSTLRDLPELRVLELNHCDKLTALPAHFATLAQLEVVELGSLDAMTDIDVLGQLPELRVLELSSLDALVALPASLARLRKLERVRFYDLDTLKDISVLARVESLRRLEPEYIKAVPRKMLAEVQNAIAARLAGATPDAAALEMTYDRFIASGHFKKLRGKEDAKRSYAFPLHFDKPKALRTAMTDFSWLDDHRDDEDSELAAILTNDDSALVPLAILDLGFPGCDTSKVDSYAEEIFLVDTADARNPVLIWGHDGEPTQIHDSFDGFLGSLRDFRPTKAPPAKPARRKPTEAAPRGRRK